MSVPPIVFADASFYIAAFSMRDMWHQRAAAWQRVILAERTRVMTTEAALWEWLNFCAAPSVRLRALHRYHDLHQDEQVEIKGFETALTQQALALYGAHTDKSWGLTDCLSFTVMRLHGVTAALTADHHFEQAGFAALLLRDPHP